MSVYEKIEAKLKHTKELTPDDRIEFLELIDQEMDKGRGLIERLAEIPDSLDAPEGKITETVPLNSGKVRKQFRGTV